MICITVVFLCMDIGCTLSFDLHKFHLKISGSQNQFQFQSIPILQLLFSKIAHFYGN